MYKFLILVLFFSVSCEKSTTEPIITQNALLSNPTWQIQKSSAIGGGFNLNFDKNVNYDPFQLAKVRVKFEPTGAVSGIDNNGNVIKDGTWKLIENEKKLEIIIDEGTKNEFLNFIKYYKTLSNNKEYQQILSDLENDFKDLSGKTGAKVITYLDK